MNMRYEMTDYCVMIVIVSLLGFLLENIWLLGVHGYIDNRNMTLPFLVGYGLTIVGFYLVIGTPGCLRISEWSNLNMDRRTGFIIYFIISFILISIGEILLGTIVERVCGFEYWNYSALPLNITKYTSVITSIGFALLLTLFMGYCFTPIMNRIMCLPVIIKIFAVIFVAVLLADLIMSFKIMHGNHRLNIRWKKELGSGLI